MNPGSLGEHRWVCPRCGEEPPHPYECPCGLTRAGWLSGGRYLEFRYPTERGRVTVKGGHTVLRPEWPCPVVDLESGDRGCEECEWDGVHGGPAEALDGERFDLT